jgi:hypothetical protein
MIVFIPLTHNIHIIALTTIFPEFYTKHEPFNT